MRSSHLVRVLAGYFLLALLAPLPAWCGNEFPYETTSSQENAEKIDQNARWDLAYYLFQIQEYGAAAQEFEKLRLIMPTDPSLLALIGSCYSMAGRWKEGEVALLQALSHDPNDEDINGLLGQFYLSAGRPLEGTAYLERALVLMPEQEDLRGKLASVYVDMGRIDRAYFHLNLILKAQGTKGFGKGDLDNAYARCLIHYGKFKEAVVFAESAYRSEPLNSNFARVLGLSLLGDDRYEQAAEMLVLGHDFQSDDPDLYLQLGQAQFLSRHWDAAEKTWLDGAHRFTTAYELLSRLIEYYVDAAKPELARSVVGFANKRNPGNPGNLLLETRLERKLSHFTIALKSLERLKRQSCGKMVLEAGWEEAQLDFVTGKYFACDRMLDYLLLNEHRKAEAHLLKAKLALQAGDKTRAQGHLQAARDASPYDLKVYSLVRGAIIGNAELAKLTQP